MAIEWREAMSVGVLQLDDDHKALLRTINLFANSAGKPGREKEVEAILKSLFVYTKEHFSREEKAMLAARYPYYEAHKREHTQLIQQVTDLFGRYITETRADFRQTLSSEIAEFLRDWLIGHIMGSDMRYKPFVKSMRDSRFRADRVSEQESRGAAGVSGPCGPIVEPCAPKPASSPPKAPEPVKTIAPQASASARTQAPAQASAPLPVRPANLSAPAAVTPPTAPAAVAPPTIQAAVAPPPTTSPAGGKDSRDWPSADSAPETKQKTSGDWLEALGKDKPALPVKPPGPDIAAILAQHAKWLQSGNKEGVRASFGGLPVAGIDLNRANLVNADLRNADLSDSDLTGVRLDGADVRMAILSGARLIGAVAPLGRFRHVDAVNADWSGADLKGADFAGARLGGGHFVEADLTGALFLDTDVSGADLSQAKGVTRAQVAKLRGDMATKLPPGLFLSATTSDTVAADA